jgi:predicted house-cleaning noncanonical NTP pyrophosphatase (MazG superfamily)
MNQKLIDEYIQWSKDTFGNENWLVVLSKLRNEEVWEFRKAVVLDGRTEQADELADCFFLLFKMAHLTGFNVEDIEAAMAKKLIELHTRTYENGKRIRIR